MKISLKVFVLALAVGTLTQAHLFAQNAPDQQKLLFSTLEKGDFSTAEQMMANGGYDTDVVKTLTMVTDSISSGYANMTAASGVEMIKTLFTVTYPAVIGTGDITDLVLRKGTLNALTTAIYNKLKGGLYSEKDLQAKLYPLLETVIMLPETFPGHKTSIYETAMKLGFTGVKMSKDGITEITIPD